MPDQSRTWVHGNYKIELQRHINNCDRRSEAYRLFCNDQELDHELKFNAWFPYCGSGGQFYFERDGHQFLLEYDPFSWCSCYKQYRLFIDNIDVDDGIEHSAFWTRRARQVIGLGAIYLLIALVVVVTLTLVLGWRWVYLAYTAGLWLNAIIQFAFGLALLRNPPSAIPRQ